MPRVVLKSKCKEVAEASENCPVDAFRKSPNDEFVIDADACIDCGACQSVAPDGSILTDDEAEESDKSFNNEKSKEWN
ncbi:MAG: hypothetical protein LBC92_04350 [Rickettsiales bacterium]|jgi:NAD-dependent dihydropyrimidine dehydrogenase PreA subunit|nr:hypothetical protein [Rickettsiales bacterium]